jgi:hypothetical protein
VVPQTMQMVIQARYASRRSRAVAGTGVKSTIVRERGAAMSY